MTSSHPTPPFPWPLALGVAFLLVGLAWGAAFLVKAEHADWAVALQTASVINLVGAVAGLLPSWLLHRRQVAGGAAYGFIGGMLVRMGLVIVLFIAVRPETVSDKKVWTASVMGLYLAFLFAEVAVMRRWLSRIPSASAPAAPSAPASSPEISQ